MSNLRRTLLCAFLISFFGTAIAFAEGNPPPKKRFYYQIRLPETAQSCQEEAVELAQRFSGVTGLAVTDRSCKSVLELSDGTSKYRLYSVVVTYRAKEELLPYSVFLGNEYMGVPQGSKGVYATYSACFSDIQKQITNYEAKTGYRAIAATCQEGISVYEKNFVLRVDGFSASPKLKEPKLRLYAFTAKFSGVVDDGLKTGMESMVSSHGGYVVFRSENAIFYYSKAQIPLHYNYIGAFNIADECVSQLKEAQTTFLNLGSSTVIARCLPDPNPKYAGHVTLEVVRDGSFTSWTDSADYFSFSECMGDRVRAMDEAKTHGILAMGAICKKSWDEKYVMRLFRH